MSDKHKLKGNIITPLRIIENGEVCFENGVITYVGPQRADGGCILTDYGDRYISPGSHALLQRFHLALDICQQYLYTVEFIIINIIQTVHPVIPITQSDKHADCC